jgi:hypothetical protein
MSAFIDCVVCRKRIVYTDNYGDDRGMSDADLRKWFRARGCTVAPTRCPDHARDKGVAAARRSLAACAAEHDPTPWMTYQGIALGGGGVFNAGGSSSGKQTLSPRKEFCQEPSHYWYLPERKKVEA